MHAKVLVAGLVGGLATLALVSTASRVDADQRVFDTDVQTLAPADAVPSGGVDLAAGLDCVGLQDAADAAGTLLSLKTPDFVLGTTLGNGTLTVNCGTDYWATATGDIQIATGASSAVTTPAELRLDWTDELDTAPLVSFSVTSPAATPMPIGSVNDFGQSILDGFDLLAAGIPVDIGIELDEVAVEYAVDESGDASLDLVATVLPTIPEVPTGVPVRVLAAATAPSGGPTETVAALRLGDGASATFPLADVFPGVDLGLAGSIELPALTLSHTPTDAGDIDVATLYADRPLALEFFGSSSEPTDPLIAELRAGSLSIAAEAPLDPLGAEVRDFFGYESGATVRLVGTADLDLGVIFGGTQPLQYASLSMTLPALGDSALLPDAVGLGATTLGLEFDAAENEFTFSFGSSATLRLPDPSKTDGVQSIGIESSGALAIGTDGTLTVTFDAAIPGDVTDPAWPDAFGLGVFGLNSASVSVELVVPGDPAESITFTVDLDGNASIAGKEFDAHVGLALDDEEATFDLTFELRDGVALSELTALFGVTLPDDFDVTIGPAEGTTQPPLRITAEVTIPDTGDPTWSFAINAPGTFTFNGTDFGVNFLVSLEMDDEGTLHVLAGARTDPGLTVGDLVASVVGQDLADELDTLGLGDIALPPVGFLLTFEELDTPSTDLSDEQRAFFGPLYGCDDPADETCTYDVRLEAGFHVMAALTMPVVDESTGERLLGDVLDAFWLSEDSALLLDAYVQVPEGATSIVPTGIGLSLRLPINPAPEIRPDWFRRATIAIEFQLDGSGLSLSLGGELGIRMRDASLTTEAACLDPTAPKHWLVVVAGEPDRGCYDLLDFAIEAEISVGAGVSITVSGILESEGGWRSPLGLDFLNFGGVAMQLSIDVKGGTPSFLFGFYVSGALVLEPGFEKDIAGSFVVGLRTLPNPPFVAPDFRGMRLASRAGIELTDVERIYAIAKQQAIDVTTGIGGETGNPVLDALAALPDISIDDVGLPNMSLRNLELMIGLGDYEPVCITTGVKLGAELYIGASPGGAITVETPSSCPSEPIADPVECLVADEPCFAAVSLDVSTDGLALTGGMGAFEVGPLEWEDALFELQATADSQLVRLRGGASLEGVASGDIDLTLEPTAMSLFGEVVLFPADSPDDVDALRALIEGTAALSFEQFLADPTQVVEIDIHAVLQSDFDALMRDLVGEPLTDLRNVALTIELFYDELKASNGDVVAALEKLPGRMREMGVVPPAWLDNPGGIDVVDALVTIDAALWLAGIEPPTLQHIVEGYPLPEPVGVPGFKVFGKCYAFIGVPGVVVDGSCYMFEPLTEIPGLADLIPSLYGVTYTEFLEQHLEPMFEDALVLVGLPPDFTVSAALGSLAGEVAGLSLPLELQCVDFRFATNGGAGPSTSLSVIAMVFGEQVAVNLSWNFAEDPVTQAPEVFSDLLIGYLNGTGTGACTLIDGERIPTVGQPDLTVDPTVTPQIVSEGGIVTLAGTYGVDWADDQAATVTWGDGTTTSTTVSALRSGVAHTYVDDDPGGTPSDTYALSVTVDETIETLLVGVINVDPAAVITAPVMVYETDEFTVMVDVIDPGLADTFDIDINWGDRTTTTFTGVSRADLPVEATHVIWDDNPTRTPYDIELIDVVVRDDDRGQSRARGSVAVHNVAPSQVAVTPITGGDSVDEYELVTYEFSWYDPSALDTHDLLIDWGDGVTEFIRSEGSPAQFDHVYGDNGTYTVTVTVTDDDLGAATAGQPIEVANISPVTEIDETGTVPADGPDDDGVLDTPTFVVDTDDVLGLTATASDPGSDDLTFAWSFGDGGSDVETYFVGAGPDPLPSPEIDPRVDIVDTTEHQWQQACTYAVDLTVTDDDGGVVADRTYVIVTGIEDRTFGPGWWLRGYNATKKASKLDAVTRDCYIGIVEHMSAVFSAERSIADSADVFDVLQTDNTSTDIELLDQHLLTAWLNVANGALDWTEVGDVMRAAEAVRLDPTSTREELLAQKQILDDLG